jgi:hypothetical protein
VIYIDTAMGPQISPVGWLLNNATRARAPDIDFAEYGSLTLTGAPADVSSRPACSHQLTPVQAAQWSNSAYVLDGWRPDPSSPSRRTNRLPSR